MKTGVISTVAGTGKAGFSGDGGPGTAAVLNQPHSIFLDRDGTMLICDIGNHRIRRLHLDTGIIEAWAGTGETKPTPDGSAVTGTAVTGPRTFIVSPVRRSLLGPPRRQRDPPHRRRNEDPTSASQAPAS